MSLRIDLGDYEWLRGGGPFALSGVPGFAGISGGRSSGVMGALLDPRVTLCFENTGREHIKTLEFLLKLEEAYGREIVWLEWRPPPKLGDPPIAFTFERVAFQTATKRSMVLFRELLRYLAAYRATKPCKGRNKEGCAGSACDYCKGTGVQQPVVPWARQRICTAYLKHRTQRHYIESLIGKEAAYDSFVGLRHDEPTRIADLRKHETQLRSYRFPLDPAGITKQIVNLLWSRQSFDLELEHDYQGNCDGCFLKDEGDTSRVLGEPDSDPDEWIALQRDYPGFGGRSRPTYEQLLAERPTRLAWESYFAGRQVFRPGNDGTMTPRRFHLVMLQERRRHETERRPVSCSCEGAIALADDDELSEVA